MIKIEIQKNCNKIMNIGTKELTAYCLLGSIVLITIYAVYTNYIAPIPEDVKIALVANKYRKFQLIGKSDISHNTRLFRFALQSKTTVLGLPCGMNISVRFFDDKKTNEDGTPEEVRRPYTPVSSNDEIGYFDMVIKIYDQGRMTQYLDSIQLGEYIEARGPLGMLHISDCTLLAHMFNGLFVCLFEGRVQYVGRGEFRLKTRGNWESIHVTHIGMIAGGTGITPMMQVIRQICKDKEDETQLSLIFGNVSVDDILLYEQLKDVRENTDNIHVYFTVDKRPDDEEWEEGVGYVTVEMLKDKIFPPGINTLVLNCGPPIMMKICEKNLLGLGYTKERMRRF